MSIGLSIRLARIHHLYHTRPYSTQGWRTFRYGSWPWVASASSLEDWEADKLTSIEIALVSADRRSDIGRVANTQAKPSRPPATRPKTHGVQSEIKANYGVREKKSTSCAGIKRRDARANLFDRPPLERLSKSSGEEWSVAFAAPRKAGGGQLALGLGAVEGTSIPIETTGQGSVPGSGFDFDPERGS